MKQGKYIVTCPMCGKKLFRSERKIGCAIDMQCSKCGSSLNIKVDNFALIVKEEAPFEYNTSGGK